MIEQSEEIKKDSSVITPAFTQLIFTNGEALQVEPERFKIEGASNESVVYKASRYLQALPHVTCRAIGLNYRYKVSECDFYGMFNWVDKNKHSPTGLNFETRVDDTTCHVSARYRENENTVYVNFNFNYPFKEIKFSDIDMDLTGETTKNMKTAEEVINELFNR